MIIREIQKEIHEMANEKGWHERPRAFGEFIALFHSELSEALEEHRKGHAPTFVYENYRKVGKPEGIPIELADIIIRILDYAELVGIDIEDAIARKMRYNATREQRHGGKVI